MKPYLLISIFSFILFMGCFIYKYKIQPSISDYYYELPIGQKWLFIAFLWTFSFPIMTIYQTPILFLAGAFICLVAVNPKFKEKHDSFQHVLFAYTGIGLGMLSLAVDFKMYLSVVLFVIVAGLIYVSRVIKNKILWQELAAIATILISLSLLNEKI